MNFLARTKKQAHRAQGDKHKRFEARETGRIAMPGLPLLARLDGRSFHSYTKGLERPFDLRMSQCMLETTKCLVENTHASVGYTQSDEISLLWIPTPGEFFFDGKYQKLCSVLSGMASVTFYKASLQQLPEKSHCSPHFDCRIWQVPTLAEACEVFVWREDDAVRNSISMLASSVFSVRELHEKTSTERIEMLFEKGVQWSALPSFLKRGAYVRRVTKERTLTEKERLNIPAKFRRPPEMTFTRTAPMEIAMPRLRHIENLERVLCYGEAPMMKTCTQNNRGDL